MMHLGSTLRVYKIVALALQFFKESSYIIGAAAGFEQVFAKTDFQAEVVLQRNF